MKVHAVYWIEGEQPQVAWFEQPDLTGLLAKLESLRARRRAGEDLHHITSSSEIPESVGQAGVDVVGPDYDWKKRRK